MPRKKSKANYFTSETEEYIKLYNTSTDDEYRAKIFTDHIYLPFYKLAENIIHTFKFYYTDVEKIEDLKHEIVSVLLEEKIMKFDPTNGAKAYSYFGTIVKRWLINYNNKNYKRLKQIGSFSDIEESYDNTINYESSKGITLASASSLEKELVKNQKGRKELAATVGKEIAKRLIEKGIKDVAFDKGGYKYHGLIKILADSAREEGLNF